MEDTTEFNPIEQIKEELFKNINSFVNEIELSFDYLDNTIISRINKYVGNLKTNQVDFDRFAGYTYEHLKPFEQDICFVLFGKQKVKTDRYNFINDISLFGDSKENCLLNLSVFKEENKNTKKSFLKYIYNIYMSSFFITINKSGTPDETQLTDELNSYVSKVQQELKDLTAANELKEKTAVDVPRRNASSSRPNAPIPNMSNMRGMPAGLESMMSSLLGNKDILNIATEISEQMKSEQINPMSMLSGLMSGKMDPRLNSLVSRVQENVENKINTGEINKEQFEEQAKSIIQNVHNTDLDLGLHGLNSVMSNLMNDMKGQMGGDMNDLKVNEEELENFMKQMNLNQDKQGKKSKKNN
jgi:hypothetical protein